MPEKGHTVEVAAGAGDDNEKFDVTIKTLRVATALTVDRVTVNGLPLDVGVVATFGGEEQDRDAVAVEHDMGAGDEECVARIAV